MSSACSPLPPLIAPVRRSETNGHGPKIAGWPGTIEIDVDQGGEHLGNLLHDGAGERRGAGRARLTGGQQQDRHAGAHSGFEAAAGVGRELQRRHHEAVGHGHERPRPPALFAARDQVQHRHRLVDVLRLHEAGADVLAGAGDAGIAGVEIELARVGQIARHHRTLEQVDVVEAIDQPGDVVQIRKRGVAVGSGRRVDDVHRGAGCAEIHPGAPGLEVAARVGGMQHETPGGTRDRVLDQSTREPEPAVAPEHAARRNHQVDARRDRIGQPDLLQDIQGRTVDALDLGVAKRPIAAARQTGPDRHLVAGDRPRAQLAPCFPAAPPAC